MPRKKKSEPPIDARPPAEEPRLRYDRPGSARYIARVVIKHAMNWDAAIAEITFRWPISDAVRADYVEKCEQSPLVQKAIEEEFAKAGLGEDAKSEFLATMRSWLFTGCESERLKAATIFGKGFVGERVTADKPVDLPIPGMKDGISRMLRENVEVTADDETKLPEFSKAPAGDTDSAEDEVSSQ